MTWFKWDCMKVTYSNRIVKVTLFKWDCIFLNQTTRWPNSNQFVSFEPNNLAYLALIEVIALPHLNAVKYVVTGIDHSFAMFVFKWTAWVYPYADALSAKWESIIKHYHLRFPKIIVIKLTSLPIDTTGVSSKSSWEPIWRGSVLYRHRFVNSLMVWWW